MPERVDPAQKEREILRCDAGPRRGDMQCCLERKHDGEHWWYVQTRVSDHQTSGRSRMRSALWIYEGDSREAMAHVDFKPGPPLTDEELVCVAAMLAATRTIKPGDAP